MTTGWTGILVALVLGLAAVVLSAYNIFKYVQNPRERGILLLHSVAGGCVTAVFLSLLFNLPSPYRFLLWIPYLLLIVLLIVLAKHALKRVAYKKTGEDQ